MSQWWRVHTETDTDIDKFAQKPNGNLCRCLSVYENEHLHTIIYNPFFIGHCVGLGVGQCEHIITSVVNKRLDGCSLQYVRKN